MRFLFGSLLLVALHVSASAREPVPRPRTDGLGDPLPAHAVTRLGSTRWRQHWSIVDLGYSSDAKLLGAYSYEEGFCLWDAKAGKRLAHCPVKYVPYGLFTLSSDIRWFAMTKTDRFGGRVEAASVEIFAADTGKRRVTIDVGRLKAIALSPDGTFLATAGLGTSQGEVETVVLWDAGKATKRWQAASAAESLKFSSDGKTLLVANDKRLRIWDVATGKELRRIEGDARKFALSLDGKTLATRGEDSIRIIDFLTGNERRRIPTRTDIDTRFDRLAVASDGAFVALAGNGHLFAWESATGKERFQRKDRKWHTAVAFAAQTSILTWSCMYQPAIHRWDLAAGKDLRASAGHLNHVQSVAFADEHTLISSGSDAQVYRWRLDGVPNQQASFSTLESKAGISRGRVAVSRDGQRLAVLGPGAEVSLLDAKNGKHIRTLSGGPQLFALAFSPNGKFVAAGDTFYGTDGHYRGRLFVWNADTGARTQFIEGHGGMVRAVAFSPDGKTLASGSDGMRLWDVATGKQVRRFLDRAAVGAIAFSPDGKTIASAGSSTILWNTDTGEPRHRLTPGLTQALAISGDGKLLATGGLDKIVRLWDLATGAELAQLHGHVGRVHAVSFSRDGRRLASGSEDTTILIWDVPGALACARANGKSASEPADLDALWADLAKADAKAGFKAVMALTNDHARTLAYFKARLKAAAQEEKDAAPALPVPAGELLRILRAIEVLERIGSAEARQMLETLAKGPPARITREAQRALERLQKLKGKS